MITIQIQSRNDSSVIDSIIGSVTKANGSTPSAVTPRIPRVPQTVRDKHDYKRYFVPKVVSIGPYHFHRYPELESYEKHKPGLAMDLFSHDKETLRRLYEELVQPEMVNDLRSFYEEDSTTEYSDEDFTKMMLLDSCFIVYYVNLISSTTGDYSVISRNEISFVTQDLFLLENQIPFKVLKKVMNLAKDQTESELWLENTLHFISNNSVERRMVPKSKYLGFEIFDEFNMYHLLDAVHSKHTVVVDNPPSESNKPRTHGVNFRSVNELVDVGIRFKATKEVGSLANMEFGKGWSGFSANVKLPPIAVSNNTKLMFFNLIAYETGRCAPKDSWVTSYVSLLGSLIDDVEDVRILRKAWVLKNYLPSDKDVVDFFEEISSNLQPNLSHYLQVKDDIQRHYESWGNTLFSQLRNEYFKSPWAIFALLGALLALFLTGVQTYFTVWAP